MKKVGRNVYGSGDTIVTKTSHFFQGLTLGAEGGSCTRYFTVHVYTYTQGRFTEIHAYMISRASVHGRMRNVRFKVVHVYVHYNGMFGLAEVLVLPTFGLHHHCACFAFTPSVAVSAAVNTGFRSVERMRGRDGSANGCNPRSFWRVLFTKSSGLYTLLVYIIAISDSE